VIYREEVLGIIGAPADIIVELAGFTNSSKEPMKRKKSKEELERIRREAENHPRVRQLRELEARGWAELRARRQAQDDSHADDR
jgi:hypothetical protein